VIGGTISWLGTELPRPQMQWNRLRLVAEHADDRMFAGLGDAPWVYFVHSLHGVPEDPSVVAATCEYGGTINAAFRQRNVFATQFHPEKSSDAGLALLANFVRVAAAHAVPA
jgi:glutamine amidotransferase